MFNSKMYDYQNNKILSRNRKASRVSFIPFQDVKSAINTENSGRITMLNGSWDFEWYNSPLYVTDEVVKNKKLSKKIQVPLNWQFDGYGKLLYTDEMYPFPINPPYIPMENETGVYKKSITVTKEMLENLSIRFEAVESAFHLFVNGKQVGYSQGSRMPSEFDITDFISEGKNEICAVVYQYSDGTYLEDQDMWWLGGITRDVYLIERKNFSIKNLILDPDYDVEEKTGVLNINPSLTGTDFLDIIVLDGEKQIASFKKVKAGEKTVCKIDNINPWTAETPNIYKVVAIVYDSDGNVAEAVPFNVGFRRIEIVDGVMLLNNQRIFMKGVNRHEYNNKKGRAITKEQTRADLMLIKNAGMNAVRTSHYPNMPYFYEVADEIGLYIIDECDLETHGFEIEGKPATLAEDCNWQDAYIDRVERMVQRDRNHACIIMWSLGNESWFGKNFVAMYKWCKQNEPMRPVHYQDDDFNEIMDVSSTMYSTVGGLYELDVAPIKKPHILCEYAHAMGNGPGSLKEYFEVCENSKRIQGVFVWEFREHGIYHKREDGKIEYRYGGDFDEKFHSGNFCLDGMVCADDRLSPSFYEYKKVIENVHVVSFDKNKMSFKVKNRYDFLDLSDVKCVATIKNDENVIDSFDVCIGKILPKQIKEVFLNKTYSAEGLLTIDLDFIKNDTVIGTHREVFYNYKPKKAVVTSPAKAEIKDHLVLVSGNDFSFEISMIDGRIYNYKKGNMIIMPKGPMLNYYRAYTDNDVINRRDWSNANMHDVNMAVYTVDFANENNRLAIKVTGRFAPNGKLWGTDVTITYSVDINGYIQTRYTGEFSGHETPEELPKIGTTMEISKQLSEVTYCGFGPDECYNDSKEFAKYGIYNSNYANMWFDYTKPQENGNRTDVMFAVLSNGTNGIALASTKGKDFCVRDITDETLSSTRHNCDIAHEDYLVVNFDYINSGLGSGSCGPKAMRGCKAWAVAFDFEYVIAPIDAKEIIAEARRAIDFMNK